jgi:hypothetical protein
MPAPIVGAECVHLIDHDGLHRTEQPPRVDFHADQHRFQRLRGREQQVGRIAQDPLPGCRCHIAVPDSNPPAKPAGVLLKPG